MRRAPCLPLFLACLVPTTGCMSMDKAVENYCALEADCDSPDDADVEADCIDGYRAGIEGITEAYPECESEVRAFMRCLGRLKDCDEYDDYWEEPTADYPCHAQEEALDDCY